MKSIRSFLLLIITGITILFFGIQAYFSLAQMKSYSLTELKDKLSVQVAQEATLLYMPIKEIGTEAVNIGNIVATMPQYNEEIVTNYMKTAVQKNPIFAGAGVAFEPYYVDKAQKRHFPYVKRTSNGAELTFEYNDLDYHNRVWYKEGMALKSDVDYAEPYPDAKDPNLIWVTAMHRIEKDGKPIGIAEADFTLDLFKKQLANIKVGKEGYAFAVTKNGMVIGSYDKKSKAKDLSVKISDIKDPAWKALGAKLADASKPGMMEVDDKYAVYAPIGNTGIKLVLIYPMSEVMSGLNSIIYMNIIIVVIAIILFVVLLSFILNKRVIKPLQDLLQMANRIADGDLRLTENQTLSNDEIGNLSKAMQEMANKIKIIINKITNSSELLVSSSNNLTSNATQSAQGATQTANAIVEVAAGTSREIKVVEKASNVVDAINQKISHAAENIYYVESTADKAADFAEEGGKSIKNAVNQMEIINNKVSHSANVVVALGNQSKEIGQIVNTISDIAGQTNLLALNAAIEAARAGEQGKGFAVVADEVRKLAEQSQTAAKQIADLIAQIQMHTDSAVLAMNEGSAEVKLGTEVVDMAGRTFADIVKLVNQVSEQVREIAGAVKDITNSSEEVVNSVNEIDIISRDTAAQAETVSAVTEEQSAAMDEITSSSAALAKMAEELSEAISIFKL